MRRRRFLASVLAAGPLSAAFGRAPEAQLRVASFRAEVTPPIGAPLCHGAVRPAAHVVDPLTARGVVLLGVGAPVVLCAVDWVGIANAAHDAWRQALAEAVGTSPERVSVHVVHQHDAPGVDDSTEALLAAHGLSGQMFDVAAARDALQRTARAAAQCVKDPSPVTHVGYGSGSVEQVASNRRILGPDGKGIMTRMSSCRDEKVRAAPEGTIDPLVRAVSFWHGDRPLACLTYYACHPQSYYGQGGVSADFPGMARAGRESALPGVAHVHFNGAGGDVAAGKYNDGSPENRPKLAARLQQGMKLAWDATAKTAVGPDDVRWTVVPVQLPVRDTIVEAKRLETLRDETAKPAERASAARGLAWLRRMSSGHRIPLGCLRIGPVWVLHMPGELCVEYQLAAQKLRPGEPVCMAAYGDLGPGYICTKIAYSQGGYETSGVSRVAPEVEETLSEATRAMLEVKPAGA